MSATTIGRARQAAALDFLGQYTMATTSQLAQLVWHGNERLARQHLLALHRAGVLRRLPHPLYRHGPFVYTRSARGSGHSQKAVHHLMTVDLHLAVIRDLAPRGVRITPELPWSPSLVPDQTIMLSGAVWAVEHHLSGRFTHAEQYRRFVEEEGYTGCTWWRPGCQLGLWVITRANALEQVRSQLRAHIPPGMNWTACTTEAALAEPGRWLKARESKG